MNKTGPNPLSPYRYQRSPVPLETSEQMLQKALYSEIHGSIYDKEQTYWIQQNREDIVVIKEDIKNLKEFDKDVYTKEEVDEKFVEKEVGKGLSSNDFTDELKEKLENLEPLEGEQSDWDENDYTKVTYVNNRTHWKENSRIFNNLYDSLHDKYFTISEFVTKVREDISYFFPEEVGEKNIIYTCDDLINVKEGDKIIVKGAISFIAENYGSRKSFFEESNRDFPDTENNVFRYGRQDITAPDMNVVIDEMFGMTFTPEENMYDIKGNLTGGTYVFEDTGWINGVIYHKIPKEYLPDDIGVEGLTDEEIIELINEKEDNNG